jgi:hypothetical protein
MNQNVYNQIKQEAYADELNKIAGGFFSKDETRARMDASNAKRYGPQAPAAAPKPGFLSAEATRGRMNASNAQRYAVKPSDLASAPMTSAKPMSAKKV